MVTVKKSTVVYIIILSLALLLPILMIPKTDHIARFRFERRTLEKPPTIEQIAKDPKNGFVQFDNYINDHMGFGQLAIRIRRKASFHGLGVTGDKYIVGNGKGAYFLTSRYGDKPRKDPFRFWRHNCNTMLTDQFQDRFAQSIVKTEKVLGRFGAKVIFSAVPTKSVLLTSSLPRSTPKEIIADCEKIDSENNGIMRAAKKLPNQNFYYPYDIFKTGTDADPLFFPNAAYHWAGESTWAFIEGFAHHERLNLSKVWPKGPCVPHKVDWDIGSLVGTRTTVDGCDRDRRELRLNVFNSYNYPLNEGASINSVPLFALTNPYASNDKKAVLVSNSFGPLVREQFASLFTTTYHLNLNPLSEKQVELLLHESDILDVDYIVIVIADFHYPTFIERIK